MAALTSVQTHRGEYLLLQVAVPGGRVEDAGVALFEPESNRLEFRLRRDWLEIADESQYEVLRLLEDDLRAKQREIGGAALLAQLEDCCSNTVRLTSREGVLIGNFTRTLERLYEQHIRPQVLRYDTHLPLLAFQPAAGGFGVESTADELDWVEVDAQCPVSPDHFVVRVSGRSMEPRIADGSLCVFRRGVVGSRNGRLVLVADWGVAESGGRYTVKRYRSEKRVTEESFVHERIWLEPLNPEFPVLEMTPDHPVAVIAEFVRVLSSPQDE